MKSRFLLLFLVAVTVASSGAQTCSFCGGLGAKSMQGKDAGPYFSLSLGTSSYGQSAGNLVFGGSTPDEYLCTPEALQFTAPMRPDVAVITINLPETNFIANTTISSDVTVVTNTIYSTNLIYDSTGTNLIPVMSTNIYYSQAVVTTTR